jgi:hypothetical protein
VTLASFSHISLEVIEYKKTHKFVGFEVSYLISSVKINGGGTFEMLKPQTNPQNLKVIISGSGKCLLPSMEIKTVNLSVVGSGNIDVNLIGPIVQDGFLDVTGSGYIRDILFTKNVSAWVIGSGDIAVTCTKNCNRNTSKTGSSNISIRVL